MADTFSFTITLSGVTREQAEDMARFASRFVEDEIEHYNAPGYVCGPDAETTVKAGE